MKAPRYCEMSGTTHPTTEQCMSNSAVREYMICCTVVQLLLGYGGMLVCVSMLQCVLTC